MLCILFCLSMNQPVVVDTYCHNYKPVLWSSKDTKYTKDQVDSNNRVYKELCIPKKTK